ncbi:MULTISPECIES: glycosyltransferase [unclassified Blastococcus]
MRVALLTCRPGPGGPARTLALAAALTRAGARVTVWALGGVGPGQPVDPAVRLRTVPLPDVPGEDAGALAARSAVALRSALAAAGEGYDVVHALDDVGAAAVPGCLRTVHAVDPAGAGEPAVVGPRALLCTSAAVAAQARAAWGRDATVVPLGADVDRFAAAAGPEGAAARGRWRARLGRYVLALGGVGPRRGVLDLVEAMATVKLARPDLMLVVAGEDPTPGAAGYRQVVDARALEREVYPLVLGPVPDDELPGLVAAAQALAVPSAADGAGAAAVEALAAGVPVVGRDLPELREVLTGVAVLAAGPPGLAAGLLAAGPPDPGRAAAGRAVAQRHGWDAAALAYLRCYRAPAAAGDRQPVTA